MNALPGGGEFGRGARREVRNPILLLPASRGILELPIESRRPLGILLRQLADQANDQAQASWRSNKGIMAAYWKAVSVYAKHLAHVIDPASARRPMPAADGIKPRYNARLIAAAHDLLEAAEMLEAAELGRQDCEECEGEGEPEACGICFPSFDDARIKRRLAIEKAHGRAMPHPDGTP